MQRQPHTPVQRVLNKINHYIMVVGGILLCLMVVHTVVDVGMTYLLGMPLEGTVEIVSRYYMVAIVFLPLAFVQASDNHIVAELLSARLSLRNQLVVQCFTWILMGTFGALLAWRCGVDALHMTQINEQIQTSKWFIPTWPSRWIPVFAGIHILIQSIVSLLTDITRLQQADSIGSPA